MDYLELRKKLNLTLKQFKTKISILNIDFKNDYSDEEVEKITSFVNSKINKADLRDLPYVNQGWIPLRKIKDELNISSGTINSYVKLLNIDVYKPIHQLSFISKEDKEKILNFINEHNDSTERKIYLSEQTCLKKFGVENASYLDEVKDKIRQKNIENKETRLEKTKKTNIEKYGVENTFQLFDTKRWWNNLSEEEKIKRNEKVSNGLKKYKDDESKLFISELSEMFNKDKTTITNAITKLNIKMYDNFHPYIKIEDLSLLNKYFSTTEMAMTSYGEKEIVEFIKSICDYDIIENDRNILKGKELDIYIPSKNVAIEFDGIYFHSLKNISIHNKNADKEQILKYDNYIKYKGLNKTIECEKLGIRLIHIWDYEWNNKKEICKSIIASSLGIYKEKYMARKCNVKIMNRKELHKMLNENHIQDYAKNITNGLGLYYNDECVQCMAFTDKGHDKNKIELVRMATKKNCQVVGGFSKLLTNSCKIWNYSEIVSYISRRLFNGKGYYDINFEQVKVNPPQVHFLVNNKIESRHYGMKKNFKKRAEENKGVYDENKSEIELSYINNLIRFYDCGTIKVRFKEF